MQDDDPETLRAAIAALEGQRATLGDAVLEAAIAPLRARLARLSRPAGLQHRQMTVLFVDVAGPAAGDGGQDADERPDGLDDALRGMAALVEAHQGRVLRLTGDGVKAAFGMDLAREDDAERAVRAGLAMLEAGRAPEHCTVRVGVHTGDVALGAGIEADNTAMGAAVNIAARMQQTAPAGALRISYESWSLVRGLFELEAQPPLQVKGVDGPMSTYLVRAARDRRVASVERGLQGLHTPMVGRQHELQQLHGALERARETRQLQALTLIGEAGLGKSRLLREFAAGLSGCRVLAVRLQADGALRPWGLLSGLLAAQCGVADTDSADLARRKVVEGLVGWFDEQGERQAQLLGQLAGLDFGHSPLVRGLDPRSLRDQALAALRGYLRALSERGGALPVLLVEDLHWADDSSLDLLQHLREHAAELPLLLVMTGRPALLARRPDAGTAEATVVLGPLAAVHGDELARQLLRRIEPMPVPLAELIVERAEGNPYYQEELVRRLIDDGVIVVGEPHWAVHVERLDLQSLPGTLVGLLQARLDALPGGDRRAARQASVIGHVFWDDALQALDEQAALALPALQRAAFVHAKATSDFEGTTERQFDHHLLHQVTYDTLLKAERRLGHGAVARWLAERTKGRGAEFLAMTGEHAERAGEPALAIDCFEQAGQEAQRRFANADATTYLRRALALCGDSEPTRRFDLWRQLEKIADILGDRAAQDAAIAAMTAVLEHHRDDVRQADLLFAAALLADRRADRAAAQLNALQAFELAERCSAATTAAAAQGLLAWVRFEQQDYAGAVEHIERGLSWARRIEAELGRAEAEAKLLTYSGMVSIMRCRFDEARTTLQTVLSCCESIAQPRLQIGALDALAGAASYVGRWDEMAGWAARMRAVAQSIGALQGVAGAQMRLALAAEGLGDAATAIDWHRQNLAIYRSTGNRRMEASTLSNLGVLHLELGDAAAASLWHAQAQSLYLAVDQPIHACENAAHNALCDLRLGRRAEALAAADALLERLQGDLAARPADETIDIRWACRQVLAAFDDPRAGPLLDQLFSDVQVRAAELTDEADRDRLIQALSTFREIVEAQARRGEA